jgi:hypothetical protein
LTAQNKEILRIRLGQRSKPHDQAFHRERKHLDLFIFQDARLLIWIPLRALFAMLFARLQEKTKKFKFLTMQRLADH